MGSYFSSNICTDNQVVTDIKYPTHSMMDKVHMYFMHPYNKLELFVNKLCQENTLIIQETNSSKKFIHESIDIQQLFSNIGEDYVNEIMIEYEKDNIAGSLRAICLWYVIIFCNIICEVRDVYIKNKSNYECEVTILKRYRITVSLSRK